MLPVELAQTTGAVVIAALGNAFTTSEAALETALPQELVNTARKFLPLSLCAAVNVYVELVAPAMFVKVTPPSTLTCHCALGVGLPLAAAANETELPAHTVLFAGLAVTAGAELTVTVALPEPELEQLASVTLVTL